MDSFFLSFIYLLFIQGMDNFQRIFWGLHVCPFQATKPRCALANKYSHCALKYIVMFLSEALFAPATPRQLLWTRILRQCQSKGYGGGVGLGGG